MTESQEFVYGVNPIREMLLGYPEEILEILLARNRQDPRIKKLLELAAEKSIRVHARSTEVLSRLAGNHHHQGVVAVVRGFRYTELADLEIRLKDNPSPLLLLLDGIQDPGNLGALLRSAHVLGIDAVLIPKDRAAGVTPSARKTSAGAATFIPVVQIVNVARTMQRLFDTHGIWWVGVDQDAPSDLDTLDLTVPLGLIIGGEGRGIRPLTQKRCQLLGRIQSSARPGSVDSLNAAAAGAIAMYEVVRQRGNSTGT